MHSRTYKIEGMTCGGCVASVKNQLLTASEIKEAHVQLDFPQAQLNLNEPIALEFLQALVKKAGDYSISETTSVQEKTIDQLPNKSISTYKPLLLIVSFIAAVTALSQFPFASFSTMLWMRHFMAGFFIVFAFFKQLNLKGFADSYKMYDIIAARWSAWGYIYPFVELTLGVLYLINLAPLATNISTAIILGVSSIGVIKSNLDKKKIRCACLGDVFNLPMSTVTIVEDLTMVGMAVFMLFSYQIL